MSHPSWASSEAAQYTHLLESPGLMSPSYTPNAPHQVEELNSLVYLRILLVLHELSIPKVLSTVSSY